MPLQKNVLTTGEVAKLCHVAPRTVSKWFDTGQLRGYRIPGSKDRRIPVDDLVRFMRANGMPLDGLDRRGKRMLVLDADVGFCDALQKALADHRDYDVEVAHTALEAGAAVQASHPDILVADVHLADATPPAIVRFIRSLARVEPTCLVAIGGKLTDADGQALLQQGFDAYLRKPFDIHALIHLVERQATPAAAQAL